MNMKSVAQRTSSVNTNGPKSSTEPSSNAKNKVTSAQTGSRATATGQLKVTHINDVLLPTIPGTVGQITFPVSSFHPLLFICSPSSVSASKQMNNSNTFQPDSIESIEESWNTLNNNKPIEAFKTNSPSSHHANGHIVNGKKSPSVSNMWNRERVIDLEGAQSDPAGWSNNSSSGFHNYFFEDGLRRVDFVLVYQSDQMKKGDKDGSKKAARRQFERNLLDEGLELEHTKGNTSGLKFVKIHATWDVLVRYAEIMKLKMPMKVRNRKSKCKSCSYVF